MLYNTWVLMIDPLNYASVNPSIEVFDGALATHFWLCLRHTRPEQAYKKWYAAKFQPLLNFFLQNMNF